MSLEPEELHVLGIDEPATERPSPIALAVLWAASAVMALLVVALLLAGISVLVGGHPWWLR